MQSNAVKQVLLSLILDRSKRTPERETPEVNKGRRDRNPWIYRDGEQVREASDEGSVPNPSIEPKQRGGARSNRNGGADAEDWKELYD